MEALIFKPSNKEDADLLKSMANKMKLKYTVITDEEKEDYALVKAMMAANGQKKDQKAQLMEEIKDAVDEMKLIVAGKKQGKDARKFLDEL